MTHKNAVTVKSRKKEKKVPKKFLIDITKSLTWGIFVNRSCKRGREPFNQKVQGRKILFEDEFCFLQSTKQSTCTQPFKSFSSLNNGFAGSAGLGFVLLFSTDKADFKFQVELRLLLF